MSFSLSLILPCYNEEENIAATLDDVFSWFREDDIDGEVIAVNDGSHDATGRILEENSSRYPKLRVLHHPKNRGYGAALRTGLDAAGHEWMGYMDSDGQLHARDFRKLLPFTEEAAFVTGRRRKRADPLHRKLYAKGFAMLNVLVLRIWVRDINCAMKLWRRELWPRIHPRVATGALFNAEMFFRMRKQGIRWKQVFVEHYPRQRGSQTGGSLKVIVRMFVELWKLRVAKGI